MTLEGQVISFDLAVRLKELGVKQEDSLYAWTNEGMGGKWNIVPTDQGFWDGYYATGWEYAAFTVAELWEIAPAGASVVKKTDLETRKIPLYFAETPDHYRYKDSGPTAAEAVGIMLAYLIENNLLKV